ncbi:MAG: hypothetical protein QXF12_04695 [Candidatus Aenigmatarchaeota archaeon]
MKTIVRFLIGTIVFLWTWGCGVSRSTSYAINDTYLTGQERSKINQQAYQSFNPDVDVRYDNYDTSDHALNRQEWEYDYYPYTRRIMRYHTGIWYDPWIDPWCSPSWAWRSAWWSPTWGWGWHTGWAMMPGWYYTPGWGWTYYAGPVWHDRGWTNDIHTIRTNYMPRTYVSPSGNTIYTPPRSGSVNIQNVNPSRSIAAPTSRPSYSPSSSIPGTSGGSTRTNIRTSSGTNRPR